MAAEEKAYTQAEFAEKLDTAKQEILQEWKYPLQREVSDLKQQLELKDRIIESLSTALANLSKGGR